MAQQQTSIVALSGGVGGAKLALGLSRVLSPSQLLIVANTGDDFTHLGLRICPDLDTLSYNLAGLHNREQGWGLADESWQFMAQLQQLGGEDWFQLGDRDLATHIYRTQALATGASLSAVTAHINSALGVRHCVVPMTDAAVSTRMHTTQGELDFQHYFVRERCAPTVTGYHFAGVEQAPVQAQFLQALQAGGPVIICPSNPFVSVAPVLALTGVKTLLRQRQAPVVAVSPIVGGQALKGPAAKMMSELAMPCSALGVAQFYQGLVDGMVIDSVDRELQSAIEDLGMQCLVTPTIMRSEADKVRLAEEVLRWVAVLGGGGQ